MTAPLIPELYTLRLPATGEQCDVWADQTLLDAMENGGIRWPSSCRNGTCRTCLGKITQGSVRYEIEWPGLTSEEKAQSCVLPCVAYAQGDVSLQEAEN